MFRRSATMSGYEGRLISAMATPVSTAVLKAVPLFASVPEEQLRMLTVVVTRKSVSRSTTVMAGGDATDSLYIVLSGRLKVMMSDSEGKEVILEVAHHHLDRKSTRLNSSHGYISYAVFCLKKKKKKKDIKIMN